MPEYKGHILVVDDEQSILSCLKELLQDESYKVETALGAKDGLSVIQRHPVDIMLTDIRMPGMDGIELIGKAADLNPDMLSIIMTGHKDMNTAIRAVKLGAVNYLFKPINIDELLISLDQAMEKIRLKKELLHQKNRLAALSEASFEAIFLSDKGVCIDQNTTARNMFGYTLQEAWGRPVTDWISPGHRDLVRKNILSNIETPYQITALRKDGSSFPVEIQARTIDYNGGKIRVTALRDVTDRKVLEKKLLDSNALLAATGRVAKVGGWEVDAETLDVQWTSETYCLHEVPQGQDFTLDQAIAFYHPQDRPVLKKALGRGLSHGESCDLELRFITGKWRHRFVHTRCEPVIKDGKVVKLRGTFQDITERKQMENQLERHRSQLEGLVEDQTAALAENRDRFKGIFNHMTNGVVVYAPVNCGRDFIVKEVNPASERIEKIRAREVLGKSAARVFPGIEDFGLLAVFRRVWRTGVPEHYPVRFYQDGRVLGWRENYVTKLRSGEIVAIYDDVTEKKEAENSLKKSRDFLQKVINGVSESLMVINLDYTIALANHAALKALGAKSEHRPVTCHKISHGFDQPCRGQAHVCPLKQVVETKAACTVEHIHKKENDEALTVEITASPIFNEDGQVVQIIEIARDVTRQKFREIESRIHLRLSELTMNASLDELQQAFLDECERLTASEIGFFHHIDPDQNTILMQTWSKSTKQKMCKAAGKKEHYPMDKAGVWIDCVREKKPVIHNDYAALPNKKGLPEGHAPILRELVVPVFRNGKIVAVLGVGNKQSDYTNQDLENLSNLTNKAWDIIAWKRAEQELQVSEERFSLFMKHLPGVAFIKDTQGRYIYANQSLCDLTRTDEKTLLGATDREVFPLKAAETMVVNDQRVKKTGQPLTVEESGLLFGEEIAYISAKFPYPMPEGDTGVAGVGIDITEKYKIRREKEALEGQLRQVQKMEAIGTLAGGIAHDFNNILAAMMGYTELAMSDLEQGGQKRNQLNQVLKAGQRARRLIQQILTFGSKNDQTLRPLKVQAVVKEALQLLRSSIPTTIEINLDLDPHCPCVLADPTQIHQVIMNLCTNAYQAMKQTGGILTVRLQQVELSFEQSSNEIHLKPGKHVKLVVSDTGAGIQKAALEKIFEPYFSTKTKEEGTGLGLAVVHGIIQRLGGKISVKSEPGAGSRFEILLPLSGSKEHTDEPGGYVAQLPRGSEHLLLVDDDEILVQMNKQIMENLGYTVTGVTDSNEAFEIFANSPDKFRLLITDMTMPKMTGSILAQKILDLNPDVPIIIVTGFSEHLNADQAEAMGIKGYLKKPVLQSDLAREVRRLLDL